MVGVTHPLTSAERQRLRTPGNLWRALIPVLVVVLALVGWQRLNQPHNDGVHVVDTAGAITAARQQAGFRLVLPDGLSNRWRPTSTEFVPPASGSPASFRIGYVTPAEKYAEFLESNDAPDAVAARLGALTRDGSSGPWARFRADDGSTVLRNTIGGVTVLVDGNASLTELRQLADALKQ